MPSLRNYSFPPTCSSFLKKTRASVQNLLRKSNYNGDEQKLLRAIMNTIREKIEICANVAIFLNKNRTITFEGETLQLIFVSGTEFRGDEDFKKNIFSAVEEMNKLKVYGERTDEQISQLGELRTQLFGGLGVHFK